MADGSSGNHLSTRPERQPSTGISVLIVGAGVGGIMTALECWRKGHDVRILERSSGPVEAGRCALYVDVASLQLMSTTQVISSPSASAQSRLFVVGHNWSKKTKS